MNRWFPYLILLILGTSCFQIRDVEPPNTTSSDWVSPSDYTILLGNLKKSISQRNVQNYLRCFKTDSLMVIPPVDVYSGNQIVWDNWSWQEEQSWFDRAVANLGIITGNHLELDEVGLQSFSSDSLKFTGNYELVMNHTDTSLTVLFKGQLEFLMRVNVYNEWEIWRWKDFETNQDSSWSRLKLKYVQ